MNLYPPNALDILRDEINQAQDGKETAFTSALILGKGLASIMEVNIGIPSNLSHLQPTRRRLALKIVCYFVGRLTTVVCNTTIKLGLTSIPAAQRLLKCPNILPA